jgi:hypothetical protein
VTSSSVLGGLEEDDRYGQNRSLSSALVLDGSSSSEDRSGTRRGDDDADTTARGTGTSALLSEMHFASALCVQSHHTKVCMRQALGWDAASMRALTLDCLEQFMVALLQRHHPVVPRHVLSSQLRARLQVETAAEDSLRTRGNSASSVAVVEEEAHAPLPERKVFQQMELQQLPVPFDNLEDSLSVTDPRISNRKWYREGMCIPTSPSFCFPF